MFGRLISSLLAQGSPRQETEAPLALAALMVRLAKADGAYGSDEVASIDRVIATRYGLSAFEAGDLRRRAEAIEAEAPDTVRFTRAIKDAVPYEDRQSVLEAMWSIALSDGSREAGEDALIRLVASLLGISDKDSALARQRVEAGKRS